MIDPDEVQEILEDTLENPYWAKYYNDAPTEKCKEFIALEFYYSEFEDDDIAEAMDELEKELTLEDWKHLYEYCGHNPRKPYIAGKIKELGG